MNALSWEIVLFYNVFAIQLPEKIISWKIRTHQLAVSATSCDKQSINQ